MKTTYFGHQCHITACSLARRGQRASVLLSNTHRNTHCVYESGQLSAPVSDPAGQPLLEVDGEEFQEQTEKRNVSSVC